MKPVAIVYDKKSGRVMNIQATAPCAFHCKLDHRCKRERWICVSASFSIVFGDSRVSWRCKSSKVPFHNCESKNNYFPNNNTWDYGTYCNSITSLSRQLSCNNIRNLSRQLGCWWRRWWWMCISIIIIISFFYNSFLYSKTCIVRFITIIIFLTITQWDYGTCYNSITSLSR